ncbi:hypothetical protein M426DRAFT_316320 [Hypoxylon sp. CI-4A]|nr:hypothetical protein M426DRAFT_316320 [Hypoxylon sp. CI-4A]
MDDAPPPPYSETDIYSNAGRSPAGQTGANDDDASVTSHSTTVYTPPETPRESHLNFSGGDDQQTTSSVHSYFESRPASASASQQAAGPTLVIALAITEDASPDEFPYPGWAREHDTTEQDWHTFLNYLLPDHSSRRNSEVTDRKLQAEENVKSLASEKGVVETQLGQIQAPFDGPPRSPRDIDEMIHEWNDGFFGPRGVTIRRSPPAPSPSASREPVGQPFTPTADSQSQPPPPPDSREQTNRSRWNPFRSFEASGRGVRIGRLAIDGDRVSFGDSFRADRNGVHWNGMSTGDFGFNSGPGSRGLGPDHFPNAQRGRGFGGYGMAYGHGRGGFGWGSESYHDGHHTGQRDRSPSSGSSSSSSSDSGSESSIGSLPDWDDLKDGQLPVVKQSVTAWLAHPEQPITKQMLRTARSNIKAAKNARPPPPTNDVNQQATRQEVRTLLMRVKELKREQKKTGRAARRERREQKRASKRERRERRTAERREHRSHRRDFRHAEREMGGNRHSSSSSSGRHVDHHTMHPHIPTPHIPSVPSVPNIHTGPRGFGGGGAAPTFPPGFPFGRHRPWEAHVQDARRQADAARAHAKQQSELARAQAQEQTDIARAQADSARAFAQSQARRAHFDAQATANAARAQAAAAVAVAAATTPWISPCASVPPPPPPPPPGSFPYSPPSVARDSYSHDGGGGGGGGSDKYSTANELEARMASKAEVLLSLRETVEKEQIEAARQGRGDDKGKAKTQAQQRAEELEAEIDGLGRDVERLRIEADEEFARRLEKEEEDGRRFG